MTKSVLSDMQRETLLANARKMEQQAAEMRARVTWSDENKHSKSAAEVIEVLSAPSTAELFADQVHELLLQTPFNEMERCVWAFVNELIAHPDELDNIDSEHVYSVVRRAIRRATKGWGD
ncbi:hypothetical protein [Lacipirellula sp.]|uniref:hypothetical protein n=1 Tax=Lacipirellula sp. TaxID=2691419 RepID=UPI003D0A11BD